MALASQRFPSTPAPLRVVATTYEQGASTSQSKPTQASCNLTKSRVLPQSMQPGAAQAGADMALSMCYTSQTNEGGLSKQAHSTSRHSTHLHREEAVLQKLVSQLPGCRQAVDCVQV